MASRKPAALLRNMGSAPTGQDLTAVFRYLSECDILDGRLVDAEFAATDAVTVRHGLGRAYKGGFVVAMSDSTAAGVCVTVLIPSPGLSDITKFAEIGSSASWTGTARLWIF
jgi:hypothetical protein